MGDLVEITTQFTRQGPIFYKITSGSLRFQVKGQQKAGIGFSKSPRASCIFWFIINRHSVEVAEGQHICSYPEYTLLSEKEFTDFWIQWHDGIVSLGRDFTEQPLIVHKTETVDLKYITFASYGGSNCTLQWRFEIPPILKQMKVRPISDDTPNWKEFKTPPLREKKRYKPVSDGYPKFVEANVQIPEGALIGGYQEEILYIIRAEHEGSLTPGKFIPSLGSGYIPWGGVMHEKSKLEFLCGYDFLWEPCYNGRVPAGAVEGGYSEVNHETLYIGRARHNNYLIPGKIQPSHGCCYIPYNDVEIAKREHEVLVIPNKT